MIVGTAVRTVAAAARAAAGAVSHAAWWLDYRVRGRSSR
jgi:hypothetical protein